MPALSISKNHNKMFIVSSETLRYLTNVILEQYKVEKDVRYHVVSAIIQTSLRGVDSHGIELFPHYIMALKAGRINPTPQFSFEKTSSSTGKLNADHTFGHAAGAKAMFYSMQMAKKTGVGIVIVYNSTHFGAAAYFVLLAAKNDFIGLCCTHSTPHMLTYGGIRPFFSTNPIAFAAPCEGEEPYCLDMATARVTYNRILEYRRLKKRLPPNWAADIYGNPTTDPQKAIYMLPIGDYKGFGMAMMIDILCSCLSGMPYGKHISAMYGKDLSKKRCLAHFFLAIDISKFVPIKQFKKRLKNMMDEVRAEPKKNPKIPIMVAGDPEKKEAALREKNGIPLSFATFQFFKKFADKNGINISATIK